MALSYEDLYFETGIPIRKPFRKHFHGWTRAYRNAKFWAKPGNDAYIGVYGYTELIFDGITHGYARNVLPDYSTAIVDKIFIDLDYYQEGKYFPEIHEHALAIEEWL